jgi:hypothetical protein
MTWSSRNPAISSWIPTMRLVGESRFRFASNYEEEDQYEYKSS